MEPVRIGNSASITIAAMVVRLVFTSGSGIKNNNTSQVVPVAGDL